MQLTLFDEPTAALPAATPGPASLPAPRYGNQVKKGSRANRLPYESPRRYEARRRRRCYEL